MIVWGEKQTREENRPCAYEFNTREEYDAFLAGVGQAVGWLDCEIVEALSRKEEKENV